MKGNVIGFDPDTNTGAISGHDGQRYDFATQDWHGQSRPRRGDVVDFRPEGRRAAEIYLLEPEYVRPGFGRFYFSPWGRISRSEFWLRGVLPITAILLALHLLTIGLAAAGAAIGAGIAGVLLALYWLALIWPAFAIKIKRMHDRNKSGWFILIPIVPVVLLSFIWGAAVIGILAAAAKGSDDAGIGLVVSAGLFTWVLMIVQCAIAIWFFVEFGCMRGTVGVNRFGPDPLR